MWQKNISPPSLEWLFLSDQDLQGTKDDLSHRLQAAMKQVRPGSYHLLCALPPSHPLVETYHHLEMHPAFSEISSPARPGFLMLTENLANAGRLATAAAAIDLSGAALTWKNSSFYLTSSRDHYFHTDHLLYNDLALPAILSLHEKEILALGLLLYSEGTFPSLLAAVDQARRVLRGQN